jgi:hypothetical protein
VPDIRVSVSEALHRRLRVESVLTGKPLTTLIPELLDKAVPQVPKVKIKP